jgi:hypothetical protein
MFAPISQNHASAYPEDKIRIAVSIQSEKKTYKICGGAGMTLARYNPNRSLTSLRDNINRMFHMTFPAD